MRPVVDESKCIACGTGAAGAGAGAVSAHDSLNRLHDELARQVMRNLVHKVNLGLGAYTDRCHEAVRALRAAADGRGGERVRDPERLSA